MQDESENAVEGDMDLYKNIIKLGKLNEVAHEDLILSINTDSSLGTIVFRLVRNAKSLEFP